MHISSLPPKQINANHKHVKCTYFHSPPSKFRPTTNLSGSTAHFSPTTNISGCNAKLFTKPQHFLGHLQTFMYQLQTFLRVQKKSWEHYTVFYTNHKICKPTTNISGSTAQFFPQTQPNWGPLQTFLSQVHNFSPTTTKLRPTTNISW